LPDFVLDTSAFINSWTYHYRLPVFEGVWTALGNAMTDGVVASPSEVLVELGRRAGDPLHTWALNYPMAFVAPDISWSQHLATLQGHAPHWFAGTGQHDADSFVVAMAMAKRLPVVTYEGSRSVATRPASAHNVAACRTSVPW
jgi:Domain of unknown function (DUF4411)